MSPLRASRLLSLAFALLLLSASALRAQDISVYATVSPDYLNHLYNAPAASNAQSTLTGQWFTGFNAGVTFNFAQSGSTTLGLDFRGGPPIGTPGLGSALAGFKVGLNKPFPLHLKPYGQVSLGWLEQRHQTGAGAFTFLDDETYFVGELFAGVDYPVAPHIDIRVVEAGIGATKVLNQNGTDTTFHPAVFTLNSGLVVHF